MDAIEDNGICCKLEVNNCSSNQMDEMGDAKLHEVNVVSGSLRLNRESIFDMLRWLKCVAIDHSRATTSFQTSREAWKRNLMARKALYLTHDETPWRKRTFILLQERATTATNSSLEKPNGESSRKKGKNSIASSSKGRNGQIQNSHSSARTISFVDNLSQKRIPSGHSFQSDKEVLLVLDSDDSANGSNPTNVKKPFLRSSQHRPIKLLKSGNNDPRKQLRVRTHPDNHARGSNSPSSNKAKNPKTQNKSDKSSDFIGDYLPRLAVPVGTRFQAEISDLVLPNMDGSDDDSKKWLGTRIWPTESVKAEISRELIGKGRPKSCLCGIPGSIQCIKFHVLAKRLQLKIDLSSAFSSWKFDQMGEDVSRSWTPVEEKSFRVLIKANPVSKNMSFWGVALKCFPSKSRESIISYYFNVFVLGRMRKQTRLAKVVDSDDDEFDDEAAAQSNEGHTLDVKNRYLTGRR